MIEEENKVIELSSKNYTLAQLGAYVERMQEHFEKPEWIEGINRIKEVARGCNGDSATERRDLVISSIGNLINVSLQLTPGARSAIMMLISELSDNIGDHASVNRGFMTAQQYPMNGYLDICIADCGMGILNAFRKIKPEVETSGQAIHRAVRGESTKGIGRG